MVERIINSNKEKTMRNGILIAKTMLTGDVSLARSYVHKSKFRSWTPAEARAVHGAAREMQRRGWVADALALSTSILYED